MRDEDLHPELREFREWQRSPSKANERPKRRASPESIERAAAARAANAEARRKAKVAWEAERYRLASLPISSLVSEITARTRAFVFVGVSGNPERTEIFIEGQDFALGELMTVFNLVCEKPPADGWWGSSSCYWSAYAWTHNFGGRDEGAQAFGVAVKYPGIHQLAELGRRYELAWGVISTGNDYEWSLATNGIGRKLPAIGSTKPGASEVAWLKALAAYRKRMG
ncbi:MAG: hypothetical protein HS116_19025 [Planctomycetes bacterium]|nr:hypothetical protein [Planctomycetota bacterium]